MAASPATAGHASWAAAACRKDRPSRSRGASSAGRRARRSAGGALGRRLETRARSGSGSAAPAARRWRSRVLPWWAQGHCLGHRLGPETAAVIDPADGVQPRLGENRLAAREQGVDPTGDPLVCARPAAIGGDVTRLDQLETGDLSELADGLERGAATGAETTPSPERGSPGVPGTERGACPQG